MDEARERNVAEQMGIKIMGNIGLLFASYQNGYISSDEIRKCVDILRDSGRHIGDICSVVFLCKNGWIQ